MLTVTSLQRRYGNFIAVKDVSFTIQSGEIVGLLGHNGAGKTTMMKMLSGYLEPCSGEITIDEVNLAVDPKRIQRQLGYLPENLPVYPEMTVVDYLDYTADLKGLNGEEKLTEIRRVVRETDIAEKLLSPIATLSRGQKQRVGVAQAILGNPKLLILDEPTNGLDPSQTQHMRELILSVAQRATVILSTHIMQEVEAICDRVLIINNGELIVDKKLAELQETNAVDIKTDIPLDKLSAMLKLDGIASQIQTLGDTTSAVRHLRLIMPSFEEAHCSRIARRIIESGHQLFKLQPVTRDLESLFKQVERKGRLEEEVTHAA